MGSLVLFILSTKNWEGTKIWFKEKKKIDSEDGGTNWDSSLAAGVFASAGVTGDGSQRFSFQLLHIIDSSAVLSHPPERGSWDFEALWGNIGS